MAKVAKAVSTAKAKGNSLPVKESKREDLNLSLVDSLDIEKLKKASENLKEVTVGPIFFPSDKNAEGEFIEGFYAGNIQMTNAAKESYPAVVLAGFNGEKFVCASSKAVDGLKKIKVGTRVKLVYEGDIRIEDSGNVMRLIRVSYFK